MKVFKKRGYYISSWCLSFEQKIFANSRAFWTFWYWHLIINIGIGILKFCLCLTKNFWKETAYYSASVWYHFGTITHFYQNSYSLIWKCPLVFQKKPLTIFGNLPVKYSWQSPFEVHLKAFLWFFQKSCFSSYSEEN